MFKHHHIDEIQAFSMTFKKSSFRIEHMNMHVPWVPAVLFHVGPTTQDKLLLQRPSTIDFNFLIETAVFESATDTHLNRSQGYPNLKLAVRITPPLSSRGLPLSPHPDQA